jgi:ApaG protein
MRLQAVLSGYLTMILLLWDRFMPDEILHLLPPLSEAVTNHVKVEVLARYSPENSHPTQNQWVFQYTVRITNQGTDKVQLISRHWIITDALDHTEEVKGPGVVGEQPLLAPGESFKYSSWCPLETPTGTMRGTYQMVRIGGGEFDIQIAPFALRAPYTVN